MTTALSSVVPDSEMEARRTGEKGFAGVRMASVANGRRALPVAHPPSRLTIGEQVRCEVGGSSSSLELVPERD